MDGRPESSRHVQTAKSRLQKSGVLCLGTPKLVSEEL